MRAQILSRKVSPKAFVERKGEAQGDIGIEGTAIEEADSVRGCHAGRSPVAGSLGVLRVQGWRRRSCSAAFFACVRMNGVWHGVWGQSPRCGCLCSKLAERSPLLKRPCAQPSVRPCTTQRPFSLPRPLIATAPFPLPACVPPARPHAPPPRPPDTPALADLKLKYYHLLIRYYGHSNNYLEVCALSCVCVWACLCVCVCAWGWCGAVHADDRAWGWIAAFPRLRPACLSLRDAMCAPHCAPLLPARPPPAWPRAPR